MELEQALAKETLRAAGTSEGASKGWDTRGRGRKNEQDTVDKIFKKNGISTSIADHSKDKNSVRQYVGFSEDPARNSRTETTGLVHTLSVNPDGSWKHEAEARSRTNSGARSIGTGKSRQDYESYLAEKKHLR